MIDKPNKVAVVIGGDLLRVPAAFPLLHFLDQSNIPIDLMVSSAGGSMLSALWGLGNKDRLFIEEVFIQLLKLRRDSPANFQTLWEVVKEPEDYEPDTSFLKEDAFRDYIYKLLGDATFDELSHSAKMAATDVYSADTVMLEKGSLADAVYASGALFPMHPAVKVGDRWLASGSYSCHLPLMRAIKYDPKMIIAFNVDVHLTKQPKKFMPYAAQFISRCMAQHQNDKKQMAIYMFKGEIIFVYVPLELELDFSDYNSMPDIIKAGEKNLEEHKQAIVDTFNYLN